MVVWCPDWPVTAAASAVGCPPDAPVAVLDHGRVLASSAAARADGVRRGLRTRDAQSRCPALVVLPYDPALDNRAFEPVVTAIEALAPGVQVIRPGVCAVRARGPERFYGTETAAAAKLLDRIATYDVPDARIGIADGPFAAEQAARTTSFRQPVRVVGPGESAAFLAPLTVDVLERPELTDLLRRLGLRHLGAFAALPAAEVLTRFGPDGALAHRLAAGLDNRPVVARRPPPELAREVHLEPAVDRVDQVAFAVRGIADAFTAALAELGLVCTCVRVEVGTESGRVHEREWLHPRWFTAADLVDRVRWQLQGASTATSEVTSPVTRVRLVPDRVDPVAAHADGLWGGGPDEQIHRAMSRVQSMLGHGAVATVVLGGGRGPAQRQRLAPWGDPPLPAKPGGLPWPGSLPAPAPATVYPAPRPARVLAADGRQVGVDGRGVLSGEPASFAPDDDGTRPVAAWAGPWPVEERWWDTESARRLARFQIVGADGSAWLLMVENGRWWTEARYD
jgi:protein ImuB